MRRFTSRIAWVLALGMAPAASANVVSADAQGIVIRLAAETSASPSDAWKALAMPARWWSKDHTFSGDAANLYLDSQATGCFCEKLPLAANAPEGQRPGSVEHMHIVLANPGQVLRMTGGIGPLQGEAVHATLTVLLKPTANGTRFIWEYVISGYMRRKPEEMAALMDGVLAEQLASLVRLLGPAQAVASSPATGAAQARPIAAIPSRQSEAALPVVPESRKVLAEPAVPVVRAAPIEPAPIDSSPIEDVPAGAPVAPGKADQDPSAAELSTPQVAEPVAVLAQAPVPPADESPPAGTSQRRDEGLRSAPIPDSKVKVWMKTSKGATNQAKAAGAEGLAPAVVNPPVPAPSAPVVEGR